VVRDAFRSNSIHGSSLSQLEDKDWRQLVPYVGVLIKPQTGTHIEENHRKSNAIQ
jgi:hypothetical protein